MRKKQADPFNEDNNDFRAKPNRFDTKRNLEAMKYIGCKSRPAWLAMCMELGIRHYGPPSTK